MNFFQKIFRKSEKFDSTEFYKYLAILNHLIEVKEKIYVNKIGERFILTRYGFKPVEQHNLHLLTEQQQRTIKDLEIENRFLTKEVNELKLVSKRLKSENQQLNSSKPKVIKYSFKKTLESVREKYGKCINNNHLLIKKIKEKKLEIKYLKYEIITENSKIKTLQKEISRLSNGENLKNKDELLEDISDIILYAENKQIEKVFRKVKRITELQEDLKLKIINQETHIENLMKENERLTTKIENKEL